MNSKIYKLRIELLGVDPTIWRSFRVNGRATFGDLHIIIQILMGWEDAHLFEFENDELSISDEPELDPMSQAKNVDADDITVEEVLESKDSKIKYTYDFGDTWEHLITVEEIQTGVLPDGAVCLAGGRNCPPEDSGGIWGYMNMLSILSNSEHPEYNDYLEWLGVDFDPEYFNLEEKNTLLKAYFRYEK